MDIIVALPLLVLLKVSAVQPVFLDDLGGKSFKRRTLIRCGCLRIALPNKPSEGLVTLNNTLRTRELSFGSKRRCQRRRRSL